MMRFPARSAPGRPDFILLILTAALTIVGLVAVWSSSFVIGLARFGNPNHYIISQLAWCALGVVLLFAASRTNYRVYQRYSLALMLLTFAALVVVLVAGNRVNGATRWVGAGPFNFQPGEFAKLSVPIYIAAWLVAKGDRIRSVKQGLVPFAVIIGGIGGLILLQPSYGTTAIIWAITATMFFVAGPSKKQMAALIPAGVLTLLVLAAVSGYRLDRITALVSPDDDGKGKSFQTQQALVAIGNGGVEGLGLGASRGKFFYIPESHTDGVFAIIGEEAGLVGTTVVLFFYLALMVRGFQVAHRCQDEFGMLLAVGITTWITVQALINMAGITSMIPLTGQPLPFLSFGGNALASTLLGMGVLMSISRFGAPDADAGQLGRRRIIRRGRA